MLTPEPPLPDPLLILAVGNRWRQDDGLGPWLGDRLAERGWPVREMSGEGASLIEAWAGRELVLVLDAVQSGAPPGTGFRLVAGADPIPRRFFRYSSHQFGLAEAVALAGSLGRLPRQLVIHGIEGAAFGYGPELSPAVAAAAAGLVPRIAAELETARSSPRSSPL